MDARMQWILSEWNDWWCLNTLQQVISATCLLEVQMDRYGIHGEFRHKSLLFQHEFPSRLFSTLVLPFSRSWGRCPQNYRSFSWRSTWRRTTNLSKSTFSGFAGKSCMIWSPCKRLGSSLMVGCAGATVELLPFWCGHWQITRKSEYATDKLTQQNWVASASDELSNRSFTNLCFV